jgi:hypothetical protein
MNTSDSSWMQHLDLDVISRRLAWAMVQDWDHELQRCAAAGLDTGEAQERLQAARLQHRAACARVRDWKSWMKRSGRKIPAWAR